MHDIELTMQHAYNQAEIMERLKNFSAKLKKQYGTELDSLKEEWLADGLKLNFAVKGIAIACTVTNAADTLRFTGELSSMGRMFKPIIEDLIRKMLKDMLT